MQSLLHLSIFQFHKFWNFGILINILEQVPSLYLCTSLHARTSIIYWCPIMILPSFTSVLNGEPKGYFALDALVVDDGQVQLKYGLPGILRLRLRVLLLT